MASSSCSVSSAMSSSRSRTLQGRGSYKVRVWSRVLYRFPHATGKREFQCQGVVKSTVSFPRGAGGGNKEAVAGDDPVSQLEQGRGWVRVDASSRVQHEYSLTGAPDRTRTLLTYTDMCSSCPCFSSAFSSASWCHTHKEVWAQHIINFVHNCCSQAP